MPQLTFVLFLLLLSGAGYTQSTAQQLVREFATAEDLANASVTVSVVDVNSGRRVAAHQPELALVPASNLKLITTAAALDLLGPDHTFRTRLALEGEIIPGPGGDILVGNVRIIGGGDPSLGSPYLKGVPSTGTVIQRWSEAIQKLGIAEIRGGIIGDGSYWGSDGVNYAWPWSDVGNYYGSGAYGLNLHENFYFLDLLQRQRAGTTPPVKAVRPDVPGLQLTNELVSGDRGSGDQAYIFGAPYGYDSYIRGSIPVGTSRFTIKGSVPDPPLWAAQLLEGELIAGGLKISAPASSARNAATARPGQSTVIDEIVSPPLTVLMDRTNLRSNNLYAEALLREINKSRGVDREKLSGTEIVTEWLASLGLNTSGVRIQDGSGLATRNFFSAGFMTDFLRSRAGQERWRQSIPLAGRSGSMKYALRKTAGEGRVAAKSGSLDAARGYAGYIQRRDGTLLAFSVMVNNYTVESSDLKRRMLFLLRDLVTAPL